MPVISISVTPEVAAALARQARALLMSRQTYVRAVIAAVAAQADRDHVFDQEKRAGQSSDRKE
jgi:hypothetical protein